MSKDKIDNLRNNINDLDDKVLNLLDERSQLVNQIGKFKNKSESVIDANREQSILDRLLKNTKGYYSKYFWLGIVVGSLLPIAILNTVPGFSIIAGGLALVGIYLTEFVRIRVPQMIPLS